MHQHTHTQTHNSELTKLVDEDQIPAFLGGTGSDTPTVHPAFGYIVSPDGEVHRAPDDDPWTLSGPIPEDLYRPDLDPTTANEITVSARGTEDIDVAVDTVGTVLQWRFQSRQHDIGFSVVYKGETEQQGDDDATGSKSVPRASSNDSHNGEDHHVEVVKMTRVDADIVTQEGEVQVAKRGQYALRFDNSFSRFRAKTVVYTLNVSTPALEASALTTSDNNDAHQGTGRSVSLDPSKVGQTQQTRRARPSRRISYPEGRRVFVI